MNLADDAVSPGESPSVERRHDAEEASTVATPSGTGFKLSPLRVCPNAPIKSRTNVPDLFAKRRKMSPDAAKRLFRSLNFDDVEVPRSPS
ncbi:hypothetical protein CLOM_g5108 [Closterium sp. NIES-68]|nr:hypothetical protein CLOM_g5108 [Closterium sp. NIES-68]GJP79263.1 hypothetical protein CLOP_g9515 [Closterium sp. NIES-67]